MENQAFLKLLNIPKTLILLINKNEKITDIYGQQKNKIALSLNNKYLKDIYVKDYKLIKKLINKEEKNIILFWEKYLYEVRCETHENSDDFILYFFDLSNDENIKKEHEKHTKDLISKKENLQEVFDLAGNGISILDSNGMFLYSNSFFQEMIEYSMDELYNESCISLSSDEFKSKSLEAIKNVVKVGCITNFKKVCVTKSGLHINASMSLSYIKSQNEILMITSDITDDVKYQETLEKQIENEVKKRTEQYEIMCHQSRLAAMGEMIDSIAHQWRQPLNTLGLIVQGLRHISSFEVINKKMLKDIEIEIMEKIHYMSETIDDFSDFFRISKQKESFDLIKNVNDSVRLIKAQLEINQIKIDIKINKTNINVYGYVNEFRQVVLNMVHNAMLAIINTEKKDGLIIIELNRNESYTLIDIYDNGGGIELENIKKVFDPYFTTRKKGSGIGLYMSKVIIEQHMNGELSVKNYKDGTQFCIKLKNKDLL